MPGLIITAALVGLALSWAASLVAKRSVSKMQFKQSDRDLINFRLQMQYAGRAIIGGQILTVIAVAGLMTAVRGNDRDILFALLIFAIFLFIGVRGILRELRIAAETELEYRKLHPQPQREEGKQT